MTKTTKRSWIELPYAWLTVLLDTLSQDYMPGHDIATPKELLKLTIERAAGDEEDVYYSPAGITILEDLIGVNERDHASDGTGKGSITSSETGQLVEEMRGVYCLDLIRDIASSLDAGHSAMMGRGSEARDLIGKIRDKIERGMTSDECERLGEMFNNK